MEIVKQKSTFISGIGLQNPIFYVSPVLNRAIGLESLFSNFHIITKRKDPLIPILEKKGVSIFCLEDYPVDDYPRNSFELLSNKHVQSFIEKNSENNANILTFRSLPQIAKLCKRNGYNYLQSDPYIVRELEDKVLFHNILLNNNIKTIPSQVDTLENCKFEGEKMVLQLRHGFAGNSTFIIENEDSLKYFQKKNGKHLVKLSPFIEGTTFTVNGCILDKAIDLGSFFVQIDNEPLLNSNNFGTCGNSHFTDFIGQETKGKMTHLSLSIAKLMKEKGYRGFFGLDIIISENNNVYPIECNPRFTASVGNYTQAEISLGKTPLLFKHISHFLNSNKTFENENFMNDKNYSFLIFRNTLGKEIPYKSNLKVGVYSIDKSIKFLKETIDFTNCKKNEYLLLPANNKQNIGINKEYLYVLTKEQLFENGSLTQKCKSIVSKLKLI